MSWTQGVQVREDLPDKWIRFLDDKAPKGYKLQAIVWDDAVDRNVFYADYYNDQDMIYSLTFRIKNDG